MPFHPFCARLVFKVNSKVKIYSFDIEKEAVSNLEVIVLTRQIIRNFNGV